MEANGLPALRAALLSGATHIRLTGPVNFYSELDCIDLDELVPQSAGNRLTIEAGGDWSSGQLNRLFHGPTPLIYSARSRDWEYRLRHLIFDGGDYNGPAFHLNYNQMSVFEDVTVQRFRGMIPVMMGNGEATSNAVFRDFVLQWNEHPMIIYNASDVKWYNGAIQGDWGSNPAGLKIVGMPQTGGPIVVQDLHAEGSNLWIENAKSVKISGGYWWVANAYITNSAPVAVWCDGFYFDGSIFVDGIARCVNT